MTASKRFCVAPNSARLELTLASIVSSLANASVAKVKEEMPGAEAALAPMAPSAPVKSASAVIVARLIVIWSVVALLAPTWKVRAEPAANNLVPLKEVLARLRLISSARAWYSWFRLARSESLLVALADCTASSRMRCPMSLILDRAPSAVCDSEMASLALRMATFMPRTWVFMRSAMARPAASSLALLTRRPVDRRWTEVARALCVALRLR